MTIADKAKPVATDANAVPPSRSARGYPGPFATRVSGRVRRALRDHFGLTHFEGQPDAVAAGRHVGAAPHHSSKDELVYILEG